ncbi:MAG: hypothetical protein RLZZ244_1121 [Verrucomicrobiota bacterium]
MKISAACVLLLGALLSTAHAQNLIQNGGFENLLDPPTTYKIRDAALIPGWNTTASDNQIEIWKSGFSAPVTSPPVLTTAKADGFFTNGGSYFAELNANLVSTLYQTATAPKDGFLSFSFWHRARRNYVSGVEVLNHVDTMGVEVQQQVNGVWQRLYFQKFSTGTNAWTHYLGPLIAGVKAGAPLRFNFISIEGSSTAKGNFLDNAAFGFLPVPEPAPFDPTAPEVIFPSPALQEDADHALAFHMGVSDQWLQQARLTAPVLSNRFELVRSFRLDDALHCGFPFHQSTQWDLWGQGIGMLSHTPNLESIPSRRVNAGALFAGVDRYVTKHLALGLYSGWLTSRQHFHFPGSPSVWSQGVAYGAYFMYSRPEGGLYADGILGGGYLDSYLRRPIHVGGTDLGIASSHPNSTFLNLSLDTGYDFRSGAWSLGPNAALHYTKLEAPSSQESDPFDLRFRFSSRRLASLVAEWGGHLAYSLQATHSLTLIPRISAAWRHEFCNSVSSLAGSYLGVPFQSYSANASLKNNNSAYFTAGLLARYRKNLSSSLTYGAGVGSMTNVHSLTRRVTYAF